MFKPVILVAALIPVLGACSYVPPVGTVPPEHELAEVPKITGTLTYRERIALLPGSIATVRLEETSRADAPATLIDEVTYSLDSVSVPFAFELELPNQEMPQHAQYSVRATIHGADGKLLFTTDTMNPVMRRPVDQDMGMILMRKVG